MWLVWVDGDANSPYNFEDKNDRDTYLSDLPGTTKAISIRYDVLQRETEMFGVTGGNTIPAKQPNAPTLTQTTRIHFHGKRN